MWAWCEASVEREGEETIWLHTAHAHTRADHQSHRGMDEGHEQLPTRESTRNSDEEPLPFPLTECCSPPPPLSLSSWLVMFAAADTHYYSYDATLLRRFDALIEPSGTVAAAAQPSDDNNRADSPPLCLELAEEEADQAEADAIAMAAAAAEAVAHAAYSRTIPLLQCQPYHAARQRKAERRARRAAKKRKLASIKQREWAIKPPPHLPRHPRTPRFFMLFSPRPREPIPPRSQRWRPQEPLRPPPKMDDDSDDDEEEKRNEQCLVIGP